MSPQTQSQPRTTSRADVPPQPRADLPHLPSQPILISTSTTRTPAGLLATLTSKTLDNQILLERTIPLEDPAARLDFATLTASAANNPRLIPTLQAKLDDLTHRTLQKLPADTHPSSTPTPDHPLSISLNHIAPKPLQWLATNRIPLGQLTLLLGDPASGKSLLTLHLAAQLSNATSPDALFTLAPSDQDDDEPETSTTTPPITTNNHSPRSIPPHTLLLSHEDPATILIPRLLNQGANLNHITLLNTIAHTDPDTGRQDSHPLTLPHDLPHLIATLDQHPNTRLLIIDPLSAFLGSNRNPAAALAPLAKIAAQRNLAILLVSHLTRSSVPKSLHRAQGGIPLTAACPVCWLLTKDPHAPAFGSDKPIHPDQRLLLPIRNNFLPTRHPNQVPLNTGLTFIIHAGRLQFLAPASLTADEALALHNKNTRPIIRRDRVLDWLRATLADGPQPYSLLHQWAQSNGFSPSRLRDAAKELDVDSHKSAFNAGWIWSLPDDDPDHSPDSQDSDDDSHDSDNDSDDPTDPHPDEDGPNGNHPTNPDPPPAPRAPSSGALKTHPAPDDNPDPGFTTVLVHLDPSPATTSPTPTLAPPHAPPAPSPGAIKNAAPHQTATATAPTGSPNQFGSHDEWTGS